MKVSICVPAYKQVDYLSVALKSILDQDFKDYELILCDDSPDDCVHDLLKSFDFQGKLIYVHNAPALGSPANWNAAIRIAKGDYVKILHHDDYFATKCSLRRFVKLLDDNPDVNFAFSATLVEDVNTGLKRIHKATEKQLQDLRMDPSALFVGNFIGAPSATICRRSAYIEYDEKLKWLVDIDYYFRHLMENNKFAYSNDPLIGTPTNATHQVTEICRDDGFIELGEAMILFSKMNNDQWNMPLVKQGWGILFRKFNIRKPRNFSKFGLDLPAPDEYFVPLMKQWRRTRWELLLEPKLLMQKIFWKFYPYVPSSIRGVMKRVHKNLF